MNKKSLLYINDRLPVVREDVYVCDGRGNVIIARERSNCKTTNIFSSISLDGLAFINEELNSYPYAPLLLVDSKIGGLLIDMSAFASLGRLFVMATHLDAYDVLLASEKHLRGEMTASPLLLARSNSEDAFLKPSDEAVCLTNKLKSVYTAFSHSHVGGRSPSDDVLYALDAIRFFSEVCACSARVNVCASHRTELENDLCAFRFCGTLSSVFIMAHKYSAQRFIEVEMAFDSLGARVDFSFDIADQFKGSDRIDLLKSLDGLIKDADEYFYICRYMIEGNRIRISSFPWKTKSLSSDLKKDKKNIG